MEKEQVEFERDTQPGEGVFQVHDTGDGVFLELTDLLGCGNGCPVGEHSHPTLKHPFRLVYRSVLVGQFL